MSNHTPGPWVAEIGADGAFAIEADRQGITGGMLVLASRNTHPLMADQMHANARLIAAAPTLLGALQAVLAWGTDENYERAHAACEAARAAIAKATGSAA